MARPYPYDTSADALLAPAKNAVFFEDWVPGVDDAQPDLLCAELARLAYAPAPVVTATLARTGFVPIGFIGGETLASRVATRGTEGFVVSHPAQRTTIVAFRGTEPDRFEDGWSDFATWQVEHPRGGRVHQGFQAAYLAVRDQVRALVAPASGTLLLTGHSLGAALATLAAIDLAPAALVTFGSPRVGDAAFGAHLQPLAAAGRVRRYAGCCDLIARVPPPRFDRAALAELLRDLGAPNAIADAIGRAIGAWSLEMSYAHVAPPHYLRADGRLLIAPGATEEANDQRAARAAYPHSTRDGARRLFDRLAGLRLSRPDRELLRALGRELFGLVRGDPVPRRDFADHAPINYLSALAGRAPAPRA